MAKALPVHIDLMLIVGLKDEPHLNVQHVVAAYKRLTAAARQHGAIELWAFETSIIERCDTPNAIRRVTLKRDFKIKVDCEEKLSPDLGHRVSGSRGLQPINYSTGSAANYSHVAPLMSALGQKQT
jgi:hypothetical protein